MIALTDLADWIARAAGSLDRSTKAREQALLEFEGSIRLGEFGSPAKPAVAWLPKPPRPHLLGRMKLRLDAEWIGHMRQSMGHPVTGELFTTRPLALAWFDARQILPPPWLKGTGARAVMTIDGEVVQNVTLLETPAKALRKTHSRVDIEKDFKAWASSHDVYPSKREADHWAKNEGFSTMLVKAIHKAGNQRKRGYQKSVVRGIKA